MGEVASDGSEADEIRLLRSELAEIREQMAAMAAAIRGRTEPSSLQARQEGVGEAATVLGDPRCSDPAPVSPLSRRKVLLGGAGAAAAGAAVALTSASPVAAAQNQPILQNVSNQSDGIIGTEIVHISNGNPFQNTTALTCIAFGASGVSRPFGGGIGVHGDCLSGSGVLGTSGGSGVVGAGNIHGVVGVCGDAIAPGINAGVTGCGTDAVGVYARSDTASGMYGRTLYASGLTQRAGVTGESDNEPGVAGLSKNVSGVYGASVSGNGVYGRTGTASGLAGTAGVVGDSVAFSGVAGLSRVASGVYGQSESANGVYGLQGAPSGLNGAAGVLGNSSGRSGVAGLSKEASGVYGQSINIEGVRGMNGLDTTGFTAVAGVIGESAAKYGVAGFSKSSAGVRAASSTGTGVTASSTSGLGGQFTGKRAAIHLTPATTSGRPTTGAHSRGDIVVGSTGSMFLCTGSGTPGTWVKFTVTAA